MVCSKCGLPLGESLRDKGRKKHPKGVCPPGFKKGIYTEPK